MFIFGWLLGQMIATCDPHMISALFDRSLDGTVFDKPLTALQFNLASLALDFLDSEGTRKSRCVCAKTVAAGLYVLCMLLLACHLVGKKDAE